MEVAGFDGTANGANLPNSIGYLPENVQFYDNLTAIENLHFRARFSGLTKPEKRINDVLSYRQFTEFPCAPKDAKEVEHKSARPSSPRIVLSRHRELGLSP